MSVPVSDVFGFLPGFEEYCNNITIFDCNDSIPPCRSKLRMEFNSLWNITMNYFHACPKPRLWLSNPTSNWTSAALSSDAADTIVGPGGYTPFPRADMWSRLTTWKAPLIQLIATFPKPPLGYLVEVFVILHLISDPIGSIEDLLYKLEFCQGRVIYWRNQISLCDGEIGLDGMDEEEAGLMDIERNFAIVEESYSELGFGTEAREALQAIFNPEQTSSDDTECKTDNNRQRNQLLKECSITAGALAADRATSFGPVLVAESVFIAVFIVNIIRLQSNDEQRLSSTSHDNIEVHSLGFSSLFLWLIPAIFTGALIGTSQTENAVPRILMRFKRDLSNAEVSIDLPNLNSVISMSPYHTWRKRLISRQAWFNDKRWSNGVYSWQPSAPDIPWHRCELVRKRRELERDLYKRSYRPYLWQRALLSWWPVVSFLLPYLIITFAAVSGVLISLLVPPHGWTCRILGEIYFWTCWVGSYLLSKLPSAMWKRNRISSGAAFTMMLLKDASATVWILWWIITTQKGYYNRPECYMGWNTGLILPEQPDAYHQLQRGLRFGGWYVTFLSLGLVLQAVFMVVIYCGYYSAIRTLGQTDGNVTVLSRANLDAESIVEPPEQQIDDCSQKSQTRIDGPPQLPMPLYHVADIELYPLFPKKSDARS